MAVETPFLSWDAERLCCHTLSCRAVCMTNQHTCFHRKHLTRWAICFHSREKKKKKKSKKDYSRPETQQSYSVLCVLTMSKHLGSIKSTKTKLLF